MIEFEKKEIPVGYKALGESLRRYTGKTNDLELTDITAVSEHLKSDGINSKMILQMTIFLECSNIRRFLPQLKTGISIVDINSITTNAEQNTGLKRESIKNLIASVIVMNGISVDYGVMPYLDNDGKSLHAPSEKAIVFSDEYESVCGEFYDALLCEKTEETVRLLHQVKTLASAGVPKAMYCIGRLYEKGSEDFPKNIKAAISFYSAAASNGCFDASARLGDLAVDAEEYSEAYKYYSDLGAIALNPERQGKFRAILRREPINKKFFFMCTALMIICVVMLICTGAGVFSTSFSGGKLALSIFAALLSIASYVLYILAYITKKYNVFAWAPMALSVVFSLFMIFIF